MHALSSATTDANIATQKCEAASSQVLYFLAHVFAAQLVRVLYTLFNLYHVFKHPALLQPSKVQMHDVICHT
jgi:hypothetical protein